MAIEPLSRRTLLRHAALGLGVVACGRALGQPADRAVYVGIETQAATELSKAAFYSETGRLLDRVPLDFRAHGMAAHGSRVVVFPRRPGTRFALIDEATLEIVGRIDAPEGRHFFGHGAFTADGRHVIVTENDLETLQGALGVYRCEGVPRRIGQIDLPGPGPHEITRHPERDLFFIALGGLETHPAYGRTPLNLHDFRSQVLSFDFASGRVEPMDVWPGSEGVSLRHLAMDHAGRLYVGGQVADEARGDPASVLWLVEDGQEHRIAEGAALGGYVSSIAAHGSEARATSKESGAILHLDGRSAREAGRIEGAGGAALSSRVEAVSGYRILSLNGETIRPEDGAEFDNHGFAL
ncbi:DUF1513 domain-containing protein [Roseivivax sp. THAF30]|uniref:DUF1513 domain-containing protein n=1 Tax=Roseivivax sp. THAF30 TaxID=2587852 RepID=UPI001267DF68|nr:DUF1513 domain-containing protein [Roseivivax sp. THAF30]QFT62648.1 hypothetical protein FIU91_06890 [Roseivivax sp. THAF30]